MKNPVIAGIAVVVVVGSMALWKVVEPALESQKISSTSDASKIKRTVVVDKDDWVGYVPFCSSFMNKVLRRDGVQLKCNDDGADYPKRMSRLKERKSDLALVELGAYTVEGKDYDYPGVFIAAIDASQGDAVMVDPKKYPTLADLRKDNKLRMAVQPNTPSEFFSYYTEVSFDVDLSSHDWMIKKNSQEEVYKSLTSGEAKAVVMWEPYVTMAKNNGYKALLDTRTAKDVIIDGLVANRHFIEDEPELVKKILAAYFQTLKHFRDNPKLLIEEVQDQNPKLNTTQLAKDAIAGARWITFTENCKRWFGCDEDDWLSEIGVEDTLNLAYRVWKEADVLQSNPFPDEDPFNLINSTLLKQLFVQGIDEGIVETIQNPLEYPFEPWTDAQWAQSQYLDKLNTGKILFQRSTAQLIIEGKEALDNIAGQLKQFPTHRLRVEGHTGTRGDKAANTKLSLNRANAVKAYLLTMYNIDPDRILTVGLGGTKPLALKHGEKSRSRSYTKRLKRVEIHLIENTY